MKKWNAVGVLVLLAFVALIVVGAWPAYARQIPPVKNPTRIEFTCPDHARDDNHEVDIIDTTGAITQTLLVGDPAADAAGKVSVVVNVQPVAFGSFRFQVRAIAGAIKGENSPVTDPWERTPGAPSKGLVK